MAERIKLNKVSFRQQKQKLAMYRRFLPALEARKQQFLMELAIVRKQIAQDQARLRAVKDRISAWSALYGDMGTLMNPFIEIKAVRSHIRNVAGLKIPQFESVAFHDPAYSFFATPASFDEVMRQSREAIEVQEKIRMLQQQERILFEGFRKTSQRINLYEQRLIPACRDAIRKITVYLQDQQAAAVGVAKVAKRLTEAAEEADQAA
jgi:V/A-type H+-transporting ATPase subunit D